MNKFLLFVTLLMIVSTFAIGNEVSQDQKNKLVGVWKSVEIVKDEPQAVLTIKNAGNGLEGNFILRGLTVEEKEDVAVEVPLTNISINGTTCSFQVTFQQGAEKMVVDWELKLQNDNEAKFAWTKEDGKPVEDTSVLTFMMKRGS